MRVDGQPGWWGAAVVGASNSKPTTLMNRPLEAISTKPVPKKQICRLPSAQQPPSSPCGSQEAQRWDKLLTATTMSSTADYRTIYCVPIVSAGTGTGTGTLGAFGCCRKHHSTHVWERHRKHPQMGKPSDVVLQLSAVNFCFGFGLVSRCRPADSWWSPDPREQVLKKEKRKSENKGQTQVTGPRRDLPEGGR